jgi:hypothetical protein
LYLCSPVKRERRSRFDRMWIEGLRSSKNFKISQKTFGHIKINFYFCTRKSAKRKRQKVAAEERER